MRKKLLSLALALVTGLGLLPATAFAADDDFWIEDGVLTNYVGDAERVVVPDGVTAIGYGAFQNRAHVTSVVLPDSVTSIEDHAFNDCEKLTSINLPQGLTSIGAFAFSGCEKLGGVTLPRSLSSIGNSAFSICTSLTSIAIPDGVTSIEEFAFFGCGGLTSVSIPDSVTSIGGYAFSRCTSLTGVDIPESVTAIKAEAFCGCTALTEITIPSGVTRLERRTFADCPALTRVVLPNDLTDINMYAFENSPNVTAVRANGQTADDVKFELPPLRNTYSQTLSGGAVYHLEVGDVLNLTNPAVNNSVVFPSFYFDLSGNQSGILYAPNTNGSTAQFTAVKPGTVTVTGTLVGSIPKTNYGKEYNIATKKWESYTYTTYEQQTLTTTATIIVTGSAFTDVPAGEFYTEPVAWAVEKGITVGNGDGSFGVGNDCKQEHILTFLWRAQNEPEPTIDNPYSALNTSDYYAKAAIWAYEKGLITDKGFDFGGVCTRAMVVTYLWKLAGSPKTGTSDFTDVPANADYAQAVAWAVENGITSGIGNGQFDPDGVCTRGQIVTFLYRAFAK